jgi:hypothetical protein
LWKCTKCGKFSDKSVYKHLCSNGIHRSFHHLWSKIPLKIKIWLWLIWHNAISTKDNLIRRNWTRSPLCQFCREHESSNHLFFGCVAAKFVWSAMANVIGSPTRNESFSQFFRWFPKFVSASRNTQIAGLTAICWAIWKLRNRVCFENKRINSPVN